VAMNNQRASSEGPSWSLEPVLPQRVAETDSNVESNGTGVVIMAYRERWSILLEYLSLTFVGDSDRELGQEGMKSQ
jgi:hypothetical protein